MEIRGDSILNLDFFGNKFVSTLSGERVSGEIKTVGNIDMLNFSDEDVIELLKNVHPKDLTITLTSDSFGKLTSTYKQTLLFC